MTNPTELKFLIVDDFAVMRRNIRGVFKAIGCDRCEEAEDGQMALNILKASGCDIVVSDINMPRMNGFDLLKAIKADAALRHLPVLLMAAETRREDIALAVRSGAAGYIVKPFTPIALEQQLQTIMQEIGVTA
jgi:two-component system, chemotaxis family, chemotaxis protein CheY